jgi:hypothetical protein
MNEQQKRARDLSERIVRMNSIGNGQIEITQESAQEVLQFLREIAGPQMYTVRIEGVRISAYSPEDALKEFLKLIAHRRRPTVIDAEVTLLGPNGGGEMKKWHLDLPHLGPILGME